jgi:peptidoglycan L-alanyl-D-glutamate endopeptidase CwlK
MIVRVTRERMLSGSKNQSNMSFKFGNKSQKVFETLHSDLQMVLTWAIKYTRVDFGLNEGYRSPEKQFEYFKKGREKKDGKWVKVGSTITNIDGYEKKGKHNYKPSLAVDIYIYVPGRPDLAYDTTHLSYVAGLIIMCSEFLFEQGKITHKVIWGANWDGDQVLIKDQSFNDYPHFQLNKAG